MKLFRYNDTPRPLPFKTKFINSPPLGGVIIWLPSTAGADRLTGVRTYVKCPPITIFGIEQPSKRAFSFNNERTLQKF